DRTGETLRARGTDRTDGAGISLRTLRTCWARVALEALGPRGPGIPLEALRARGSGVALEALGARGARVALEALGARGPDVALEALRTLRTRWADIPLEALRSCGAGVTDGDREVEILCNGQEIRRRLEPRGDLGHDVCLREAQYLQLGRAEGDRRLVPGPLASMDEEQAVPQVNLRA